MSSTAEFVILGLSLAAVFVTISAVLLIRHKQLRAKGIETPETLYLREIKHLRGGGIHPGGQPYKGSQPRNDGLTSA